MPIGPRYPSPEALIAIANDFGIELLPEDAKVYREIVNTNLGSYRELDRMVEPKLRCTPISSPIMMRQW